MSKRSRFKILTTTLILLSFSSHLWVGTMKVEALVYPWTLNTSSTGEFLSCFAHLYANEYWQSKGFHFATLILDNSASVESEARTISIVVEKYSNTVVKNVTLAPREKKTVYFDPTFVVDLKKIATPTPATVTFKAVRSDGFSFTETKTITILPANNFSWGKGGDLREFSIVFSTPGADPIVKLLDTANKTTTFPPANKTTALPIRGYKEVSGFSREEIVSLQMKAVYNTVKALGVTYVNSSLGLYETKAQFLKSPREMMINYSGNALEIALLFTSAFESIDLRPFLVFTTNHVFVAVAEWKDNDRLLPLDTALGTNTSYEDARARGKDLLERRRTTDPAFLVVDVSQMRKTNKVAPCPYLETSSPQEFQQKVSKVSNEIDAAKTAITQAKTKVDSIRNKTYDNAQARTLRQRAIEELALAFTLFSAGKYVDAKSHADQAADFVSKAEVPSVSSSGQFPILTVLLVIAVIAAAVVSFAIFVWRRSKRAAVGRTAPQDFVPPDTKSETTRPQTITCQKCGATNAAGAKFCEACGEQLKS